MRLLAMGMELGTRATCMWLTAEMLRIQRTRFANAATANIEYTELLVSGIDICYLGTFQDIVLRI